MNYQPLIQYARTDRQKFIIQTLVKHNHNVSHTAKDLGINRRSVQRAMENVRKYAAQAGFSPEHDMTHPVPDGFHVKGVSTYYDKDGNPRGQWVKSNKDKDDELQHLIESLQDTFDDYKDKSIKVKPVKQTNKDLMTVYPMGDPHIGMYAWHMETGEDFDLDIAEANLVKAVRTLVSRSPDSHTAVILNLGDFFHADNMDNATARNKNTLDVDSRWAKVLRVGARAMIECIYAALEKHKKVIVKNLMGNHDDHTSQALSVAMSLYFHNNPRVEIDDVPAKFWYYSFGSVLIGATHGDTAKPAALPGVMATDQAKAWGESEHRYWYTGHIHTTNKQEFHGCVWESFRTLAARDAWHTAQGYRAGRDMVSITHHKDFGEIERHTMNIAVLRGS